MSEGTATPRAQAHSAYLDARGRALGFTNTGLRLAAWRLRRRRPHLDWVGLARLRAFDGELLARERAQ